MSPTPVRRPLTVRALVGSLLGRNPPPVGAVRFGSFDRLTPISRDFGYDRGQPVDRYYIEAFLASHAAEVRGHVVEVGDDAYTRRFGGDSVTRRDILHVSADNPQATLIADLADAANVPSDRFDCVIVTQTLHLIYDMGAAVRTLHRILRPGGVCLATVPGISQVGRGAWQDTWYWALTGTAARRLFSDAFGGEGVSVETHGNVLASCAFLQGIASDELTRTELDYHDPSFPLVVTVRAVKTAKL